MNEAVFPLIGPLIVLGLVLPLSAAVARMLLLVLGKLPTANSFAGGHGIRYTLLLASSALPLGWFISASLHQAETGESALVCIAEHAPGAFCAEAAYFALALSVLAVLPALPGLFREQFLQRSTGLAAERVRRRLEGLIRQRDKLRALEKRVVISENATAPIATVGILVPRVVVQAAFADSLDDEALAGALYHEFEHVRGWDPLRYFLASWAVAVNPFGRWLLRAEYARWLLARELHCDREAVLEGASAAGLAQALIAAARPAESAETPALGAGQLEAIQLRVGLLLAYADRAPRRCSEGSGTRLVLALIALAWIVPHRGDTELLDAVHEASESAAALIVGK